MYFFNKMLTKIDKNLNKKNLLSIKRVKQIEIKN